MKKLPKKIDCRVDYPTVQGKTWSLLVESETGNVLDVKSNVKGIDEMYKELKFKLKNYLTIDNYPYGWIKYYQIEGAKYDFPFN